jgi:hypothetical protein
MTSTEQPEYHSFDEQMVTDAINSVSQTFEGLDVSSGALAAETPATVGVLAQCLGVIIRNRRVCLRIPVVNRNICLRLPINIPDGTVAEACLDICHFWSVPSGACVEIRVAGRRILRQCFGFSC